MGPRAQVLSNWGLNKSGAVECRVRYSVGSGKGAEVRGSARPRRETGIGSAGTRVRRGAANHIQRGMHHAQGVGGVGTPSSVQSTGTEWVGERVAGAASWRRPRYKRHGGCCTRLGDRRCRRKR